jgi:hypothetical protein
MERLRGDIRSKLLNLTGFFSGSASWELILADYLALIAWDKGPDRGR